MGYLSNITGTTSSSFKIGDVTVVVSGDIVKIVYPDTTEIVVSDKTPAGFSSGDPVAVEGLYDDAPGGYSDGQAFAISKTPSGQFAAHAGQLAVYNSPVFDFVVPTPGWIVFDKSQGIPLVYSEADGWINWTYSPAEVRAAVDAAIDSNVFTDAEKTKLASVESGATGDMTASEILAALLTVDGDGSGLDADLLDGQTSTYYRSLANATGTLPGARFTDVSHGTRGAGNLHSVATTSVSGFMSSSDKTKLDGIEDGATGDMTANEIRSLVGLASGSVSGFMSSADKNKLDAVESGATGDMTASEILAALLTVDGTNSGLDADRLDGFHASTFATVANPTFTGTANFADIVVNGSIATISQQLELASTYVVLNSDHTGTPTEDAGITVLRGSLADAFITWDETLEAWTVGVSGQMGMIWTDINDGAGSGLDADKLDGQHGSYYLALANATGTLPSGRFSDVSHGSRGGGTLHAAASGSTAGFMSASDKTKLDGIESGANNYSLPASVTKRDQAETISENWNWITGKGVYFGNTSSGHLAFESSALILSADANSVPIRLRAKDSSNVLRTAVDATGSAVSLYAAGTARLVTSNTGVTVTGNIAVSGTVDGYDVSTMGEKLASIEDGATADMTASEILAALLTVDGSGSGLDADFLDGHSSAYFAPIASPSFTGTPTAPTPASNDSSSKIATTAFVNSAASGVLTADAVTNAVLANMAAGRIKGRALGTDGDPQDLTAAQVRAILNVEDGATADMTASEILAALLTVDGSGSGLDADLLDGITSSAFGKLAADQSWTGANTFLSATAEETKFEHTGGNSVSAVWTAADFWALAPSVGGSFAFDFDSSTWVFETTPTVDGDVLWNAGNDGSGSGLDADLLDGHQAAEFALLSGADFSGSVTIGSGNNLVSVSSGTLEISRTGGGRIDLKNLASEDFDLRISYSSGDLTVDSGTGARTVWDSGNDGAGSGLDADLLDGLDSAAYARSARTITAGSGLSGGGSLAADRTIQIASGGVTNGMLASVASATFKGRSSVGSGNVEDLTATEAIAILSTVDGSGSGLDADLLDGQHGSYYLALANATGTLSGSSFSDSSHGSRSGGSLHAAASGSAAGFMSASDKTKLDGIESGATADMTASEILAALLTVDGSSSGLDADLLDGHSSAYFATSADPVITGTVNIGQTLVLNYGESGNGVSGGSVAITVERGTATDYHLKFLESVGAFVAGSGTSLFPIALRQASGWSSSSLAAWDTADGKLKPAANLSWNSSTLAVTGSITTSSTVNGRNMASDGSKLDGIESGATADMTASEILAALLTVDGAGSLLDADTLDGQHGSYFAPIASPSFTGTPTAPTPSSGNDSTRIATTAWVHDAIELATGTADVAEGSVLGRPIGSGSGSATELTTSDLLTIIKTVDGSGSGLDADTVDGVHAAAFALLAGATFSNAVSSPAFSSASAILKTQNTTSGSWSSVEIRATDTDGTLGRGWVAAKKGDTDTTGELALYVATGSTPAKALTLKSDGTATVQSALYVADGSESAPTLAGSASTTGLFFDATKIAFAVSGTEIGSASAGMIRAANAAGGALLNEAATATNPTLVPNLSDTDTGIGWNAANELTMVAGGSTQLTITSSGVTIAGSLTISGSTTTVHAETVTVDDNIIVLNNNVTGTPSEDSGIEVERGTSTNATLYWDEGTDTWKAGLVGSASTILTAASTGINADTLDTYDSTDFPRKAETATISAQWTFSSAILGADGTASAPGYSFSGDTNTGIYRVGADQIGLSLGGTARFLASTSSFSSNTSAGPALMDEAASSTNPTLIPNKADLTTGIGAQASGNVSTVVGGTEITRATSTGLAVTGALSATTKSFDIVHPTEKGKRLRYGSLEGPELGVYIRGTYVGPATGTVVEFPKHWKGLVRKGTVTAVVTAIGKERSVWISEICDDKMIVKGSMFDRLLGRKIRFSAIVFGERADVMPLIVEYTF